MEEIIHTPLGITLQSSSASDTFKESVRQHTHVVLVEPEHGGNVGAAARARMNMGIKGRFILIGDADAVNADAERLSKHAKPSLKEIEFYSSLENALRSFEDRTPLIVGTSSRTGSSRRPHPLKARDAAQKAILKISAGDNSDIVFVFGREGDGLTNLEFGLCDWVVTIPSTCEYDSLNLAQAVLIFCYEINLALTTEQAERTLVRPNQKQKLIAHWIELAKTAGFILPGDPFKMQARLEEIFGQMPPHIDGASTLHGFIDQAIRSIQKGAPDFKGRFRHIVEVKDERPKTR